MFTDNQDVIGLKSGCLLDDQNLVLEKIGRARLALLLVIYYDNFRECVSVENYKYPSNSMYLIIENTVTANDIFFAVNTLAKEFTSVYDTHKDDTFIMLTGYKDGACVLNSMIKVRENETFERLNAQFIANQINIR